MASESFQPGLINLVKSKFEFNSAHVKYCTASELGLTCHNFVIFWSLSEDIRNNPTAVIS